jgi:hypothetical protein
MSKTTTKNKDNIAEAEYKRLVALYKSANVDEVKLKINDRLIHKVAEVFACLENIKDLPTLYVDPKNNYKQVETAAGKVRVKYMAQYSASMQKLNKDLLGTIVVDDNDLDDFE